MRELRGDWRDIFNGFSVALDIKKLLMGFMGIALTVMVGVAGPFFLACLKSPTLWSELKMGTYGSLYDLYYKSWQIIFASPVWQIILISALFYLFLLIIWAFFGGAISRIAAINLTKDEGLEVNKALSFATNKYVSYLMPAIISILGFLFFFFWNFLGGLVGRIPYAGELLVVIFLPLAILSAFIMVFIAVGFFFSCPLFYPTIAVEGSDSFDALSRSFSYLYAKPWHYIWYHLVSFVYGLVSIAFVWVFGYFMIIVALWAGGVGMGAKFGAINGLLGISGKLGALNFLTGPIGINLKWDWLPAATQGANIPVTYHIAAFILAAWLVLVVGFILAYVVSYYFSAQTIIYLLMRKKVDEIDVKEVWEETEEETFPTTTPPETPKPEAKKEEEKPEEKKT